MNANVMRHLGNALALTAVVVLSLACFGDLAYAQGSHSGAHSGGASSDVMGGIEHGTRDFLEARLKDKRPGDPLTLAVFRADELRTLTIKLGPRPAANYRIAPLPQPTEQQRRVYQSWLGAPLR